jgi:hypothetical protein
MKKDYKKLYHKTKGGYEHDLEQQKVYGISQRPYFR